MEKSGNMGLIMLHKSLRNDQSNYIIRVSSLCDESRLCVLPLYVLKSCAADFYDVVGFSAVLHASSE